MYPYTLYPAHNSEQSILLKPMKTILIVSANPKDTRRIRLDEEVREIEEGLRRSKHRDQFAIHAQWAVRVRDLRRAMLDCEPQIVHFCGHGEEEGVMVEDDHGQAVFATSMALAGLFALFTHQVECVLLNACYSDAQAEAIAQHINYVIGMRQAIGDHAAIEFAVGFYDALGAGRSYEDAYKFGCNAIQLKAIPEDLTPILRKKATSHETELESRIQQKEKRVLDTTIQEHADIKVFICYKREDKKFAERVYQDLKQAGVTSWMDIKNLLPGQNWKQEIFRALTTSSYVIVLLSQRSLTERGFIQKELKKALDIFDEFPASNIFLIPARIEECDPIDERLQDLHWVDLFPEDDYNEGFQKILGVVSPEKLGTPISIVQEARKTISLRSEPLTVSEHEFRDVFKLNEKRQPLEYIQNDFEDQRDVILDHTTGLMWQQSGSETTMIYQEAQAYIEELNRQNFAGFDDWRLPTVEELMSLLEPEEQSNGVYINPIFDTPELKEYYEEDYLEGLIWWWSADRCSLESAWSVGFKFGDVSWDDLNYNYFVRAVRGF